MQCDNCGYIFFQPSKKCSCCSAPYVPAQSSFDVGQENLFTIFEMAPGEGGIPSGMGMEMSESSVGIDDYNFTDDFDAGGAEYGVDENVLDLSDAEAEGFGIGPVSEPRGVDDFEFDTSGMDDMPSRDNAGPDDFELNLGEDLQDNEAVATEAAEPDIGNSTELDFSGGFDEDEVEGLGFGLSDSSAEGTLEEATEEVSLDTDSEPEISLEPELELAEEEPSLEVSEEPELDIADEQPSLDLAEDPSIDFSEEISTDTIDTADDTDEFNVVDEGSMELPGDLDLAEEPELMESTEEEPELMEPSEDEYGVMDDDSGLDFDLDSVDLDVPEDISFEGEPEAAAVNETPEETPDEESFMDLEGLEMENSEDPEEDEGLKQ